MARKYVPKRGDIVWMNFNPAKGHEQAGTRPALVVSSEYFNRATGLAYVVPVTSKKKGYEVEVPIQSEKIQGVALTSALRSIDWRVRKVTFVDRCEDKALRSVQGMLVAFITDGER